MRSLSISCCLLLCAGFALAQSDRGTITGTVSDSTKAVLANAPVEAKSLDTGTVYKASTSGTGNYTIAELPAGAYEVSVIAKGFKKEVQARVEVTSYNTFRVDFVLQIGNNVDV